VEKKAKRKILGTHGMVEDNYKNIYRREDENEKRE
jgi:hypothetical protein